MGDLGSIPGLRRFPRGGHGNPLQHSCLENPRGWRSLAGYSLLLSHFSRVRLCATPWTAAHQAPPSLGFSRQEHWSGLPFPSPMHENEEWKWSRSVVFDSSDPMDCSPPGSSTHGSFQTSVLEWGATAFSRATVYQVAKSRIQLSTAHTAAHPLKE